MYSFDYVKEFDPVVAKAMEDELQRQRNNIELIASENLVSRAVMEAMGSHLTNKYAEGYPGKQLKELRSFSVVHMQMFSLTQVLRLTSLYSMH